MLEYIAEVIIWTLILYVLFERVRIIVWRYIIRPGNLKKIYSKTKSEN